MQAIYFASHVTQDVTHHWTATAFAKSIIFKYLRKSQPFFGYPRAPLSPSFMYSPKGQRGHTFKQLQAPQESSFLESFFLIYKN